MRTRKQVLKQADQLLEGSALSRDQNESPWSDSLTEQILIGSMMIEGSYSEVEAVVTPEMFSVESYRDIARAIAFLWETGRSVDPLSIKNQLKDEGKLTEVSTHDIMQCAKSAVGFEDFLEPAYRLRDLFLIRESRRRVKDWYAKSNAQTQSAGALLEELNAVASFTVQEVPNVLIPFSEIDLESSPDEGFTTGFDRLNKMIQTAGYPKGQVSVVEAYHKGGKSTFMLSSFSEQIKLGIDPVYVSFADLNATRIKRRLMRIRTKWGDVPTVSLDLMNAWHQEHEELCEQDPRIVDATKSETLRSVEGIVRYLKGLSKKRAIQVVFLDYFQRITTSDPKARTDYDKNKIVADKLANFAEETGIAVIVGSQVTPGGKDRETISKGGRDIEENAGWVLRLKRENDSDVIEVEIPFSRFGIQSTRPIEMTFDKERLCIY